MTFVDLEKFYQVLISSFALTAKDEGCVAEGGESGALVVDVRLQGVRLGTLPLDVLLNYRPNVK